MNRNLDQLTRILASVLLVSSVQSAAQPSSSTSSDAGRNPNCIPIEAFWAFITFSDRCRRPDSQPDPPAPAPPPPPPPPPAVICMSGPYLINFDWESSDMAVEANAVLDKVAQEAGNCGNLKLIVAGHSDTSEIDTVAVSSKRARSVASSLIARGIPASRISTIEHGASQLRVPTAMAVRESLNRRVEIHFESSTAP